MTTASEGQELTQVGPGTPMGRVMRHYWLPALKSSELERDGPPTRFMLLGEKLLAFRDSAGRVGVMDHRCPHRCASLFLGRNEQGGLRCIYHGWKFDVAGNCLDMPKVPEDQDFKHKVKAEAYRVMERAGPGRWVHMGEGAPQALLKSGLSFKKTLLASEAEREDMRQAARRTLLELIGFDVGVHPSGDALRRGDAAWRPQLAELWEATVAAARRAALDDLPIDMHRGTAALRR